LSVDDNCMLDSFEYININCAWSNCPDGWDRYVVSPDCASSRGGVMNPTDPDDEVMVFKGEAFKRDISSLGLTSGTTITVSIMASVANEWGSIYNGDFSFAIRIFDSEPPYNFSYGAVCSDDNGGQQVLSGFNDSMDGILFTDTITLNQNANWIAIGNCYITPGTGGNIFDDLEICW